MMASIVTWLSGFGLSVVSFLFIITLVVFFHELGHFWVGRRCGVKVDTFSIGFGPEIFGWNDKHGTRWKLSWLPLGGYVKFHGDADPSSKSDPAALDEMDAETKKHTLHHKRLYQRAAVVAAGPIANFILAIVIFTGLYLAVGAPPQPPVVASVVAGSAAESVGIKAGDILIEVNGKKVASFGDVLDEVTPSAGKEIGVRVRRGGEDLAFRVTPHAEEMVDPDGITQKVGRLGIIQAPRQPVGPVKAFSLAVGQTWDIVAKTMGYLGRVVTGHESPSQLHGPLGIANIAGNIAEDGILSLLSLAGFISVSLGLLNLFPIPVLDGGHLLYYACEAVLGRPLGERAQEIGFRVGLAFVLSLMLLATFNDLVRLNLF